MSSEIKVYKIKDFLRKTEAGNLDRNRLIKILHEVVAAAAFHSEHNILIDFRDTKLSVSTMTETFEVIFEIERFAHILKNKIANVVPNDELRLSMARMVEDCLRLKGFQYEVFTNFEKAIEWLSETSVVGNQERT